MRNANNIKDNSKVTTTAVATIFTLAIIITAAAASSIATPTAATTATTTEEEEAMTTPQATSPPSEMIELSPEIVYQERQINTSETPINQTHIQLTTSGNGTLTLPNTTETISTTSTGSILASLDGTAAGKVVITTEDGSESVTATIYATIRFGMEEGRGIVMALLDTDSTTAARLAPLDGMILAGLIEFPPEETAALITLWEWQSGIPLPPSPTPTEEPSPLAEITTNATTATAPGADGAAAPDGEGEQQTTTTIPPTPLLE